MVLAAPFALAAWGLVAWLAVETTVLAAFASLCLFVLLAAGFITALARRADARDRGRFGPAFELHTRVRRHQ